MKRETAFFEGADYTATELRELIVALQQQTNDEDFPMPPRIRAKHLDRIAVAEERLATITG